MRSPAISQYVWLMRLLGGVYALAGAIFFFFPREVVYLLNVLPRHFTRLGPLLPEEGGDFWRVLAVSMMATLVALSFLAAGSPRTKGYGLVHVLAQAVSSSAFLYLYLNEGRQFASLVGTAVSLPLALIVALALLRAGLARDPAPASATSAAANAAPAPSSPSNPPEAQGGSPT